MVEWVAVDWGTSNVRAWGIDAGGNVAFSEVSDQGMGKLTRDQYPGVLGALVKDRASEIVICGMAGPYRP